MKKIEAIIHSDKLNGLIEKLNSMGLKEFSTVEINKYYESKTEPIKKTKVEMIVNYTEVDKFVEAIKSSVRTDNRGDDKILVSDLEKVVKIKME